jgi:hypothetical protein
MVKSTVVGITPANHAASHYPAGTDPLTMASLPHHAQHDAGAADAVEGTFIETTSSIAATGNNAYIVNDISATVGSNEAFCIIELTNDEVGNVNWAIRRIGSQIGSAVDLDDIVSIAGGATAQFRVFTSSTGTIEIYANAAPAQNCTLDIKRYMVL